MNLNSMTFSVDLVNAAKNLRDFLELVDKIGNLCEGYYLERALYRYEVIWLPLLQAHNNDKKLIPPIDVQWVWNVHMLSPTQYIEDMKSISNFVFDHHIRSADEIKHYYEYSKQIWEKYSSVS